MNKNFKDIISAALSGDEAAYEALYTMTKDPAYFVALSMTHNEQDALDILQESYIKAFTHLDTVDPPENFDNWFNRIVANCSKDFLKRKKPMLFSEFEECVPVEEQTEETNPEFVPHENIDKQEASRLIMEIINRLPENKRLVILMYYYQEIPTKDIAEALELPLTTVKYYLLESRKQIKSELEKLDKEGTRLYAAIPFSLFPSLIGLSAGKITGPAFSDVYTAVTGTVTGDAAASASTANAASSTNISKGISGGKNIFLKTTISKIIVGVAAVAVVGGGIAAAVAIGNNNNASSDPIHDENVIAVAEDDSFGEPTEDTASVELSSETELLSSPIEDFSYEIEGDGVAITRYYGNDTDVVIPETIEGKPVTAIKYKKLYKDYATGAFEDMEDLESITIPNSVTEIGDNAFRDCYSLKEVDIPESVTKIGDGAFIRCQSFKSIELPENVTEVGKNAFFECTRLESVDMGKNITKIGYSAFCTCSTLKSIRLSDSLKEIEGETFSNCGMLENITIPNSVTIIGDRAFYNCNKLKDIILPKGLESIGSMAFMETRIKSMYIPESVTNIGNTAFAGSNSWSHDNPFVIKGKKGSYAETYAAKYVNVDFVASDN